MRFIWQCKKLVSWTFVFTIFAIPLLRTLMNGGGLLMLKELLGHSSLEMVQRYAHLASEHKRRQLDNLAEKYQIPHLNATPAKSEALKEAVNYN